MSIVKYDFCNTSLKSTKEKNGNFFGWVPNFA